MTRSHRDVAVLRAALLAAVNAFCDSLDAVVPERVVVRPPAANDPGEPVATDLDRERAKGMLARGGRQR